MEPSKGKILPAPATPILPPHSPSPVFQELPYQAIGSGEESGDAGNPVPWGPWLRPDPIRGPGDSDPKLKGPTGGGSTGQGSDYVPGGSGFYPQLELKGPPDLNLGTLDDFKKKHHLNDDDPLLKIIFDLVSGSGFAFKTEKDKKNFLKDLLDDMGKLLDLRELLENPFAWEENPLAFAAMLIELLHAMLKLHEIADDLDSIMDSRAANSLRGYFSSLFIYIRGTFSRLFNEILKHPPLPLPLPFQLNPKDLMKLVTNFRFP